MPQPLAVPERRGNAVVAVLSAWLVPGLGHLYLKRPLRGLAFFVLVVASVLIGCTLEGNLYRAVAGQPLTILATFASMGMGFLYFLLRYALHYQGNIMGAGYEYGTAFLLTAGLMNLLLVLDVWDIVRGKKE
jgi:TM2 domain-containing membrane protein YozV